MKPIVFHVAASEEVQEAAAWYENHRAGLGREFRIDLEAVLDRIRWDPQIYGVEIENFRAGHLQRFPYMVIYVDLGDRVWVVAVAHQARRPDYWLRRKPT